MIAGDGPERGTAWSGLTAIVLGLAESRPLSRAWSRITTCKSLYSAADALVLASSREGWPNVLLESLASGTPVIATRNWGTPEIVTAPEAGLLIDERAP